MNDGEVFSLIKVLLRTVYSNSNSSQASGFEAAPFAPMALCSHDGLLCVRCKSIHHDQCHALKSVNVRARRG